MTCKTCRDTGEYWAEQPNRIVVRDSGNGNSMQYEERVGSVRTICDCEAGKRICPKCWNAGYTRVVSRDGVVKTACDCAKGKAICPKCFGSLEVLVKNPEGARPPFHSADCESCKEGRAKIENKIRIAKLEEIQRKKTIWECSQVPPRFKSFSLDSSPILKSDPKTKELMMQPVFFEANEKSAATLAEWEKSWYIHGPVGVGKTGIAVGICREHIELEDSVLFKSVPKLLKDIKDTWGKDWEGDECDEGSILAKCAGVDVLVLDDICAEYAKVGKDGESWVRTELYEIINDRHSTEKAIIFTSNCSLKQLGKILGERIESRIREMCGPNHIIFLNGPDLRSTEKKGE